MKPSTYFRELLIEFLSKVRYHFHCLFLCIFKFLKLPVYIYDVIWTTPLKQIMPLSHWFSFRLYLVEQDAATHAMVSKFAHCSYLKVKYSNFQNYFLWLTRFIKSCTNNSLQHLLLDIEYRTLLDMSLPRPPYFSSIYEFIQCRKRLINEEKNGNKAWGKWGHETGRRKNSWKSY